MAVDSLALTLYNTPGKMRKKAVIFAEKVEQSALDQFHSAMALDYVVQGALMPDAHTGYTLPIGGVVATKGVILPSWVGYDIGCGLCALKTGYSPSDISPHIDQIYREIYHRIPTGFNHNKKRSEWDYHHIDRTDTLNRLFESNGLNQLCSLGSGNHFIEIGKDETDAVWIIVHSGSRGIGHAVATHYMKLAAKDKKAREGHFGFMVDSAKGKDYITDLDFCLAFALENRKQMILRILSILEELIPQKPSSDHSLENLINRNHNHAELKDGLWIHRKGATHAEKGMLGVVPGNMRDGTFIVEGLGNPDSLWSSSHGAGRVMGRKKAKKSLSLNEFKATMSGIKAKVTHSTLDESPFAYKDIFEVMEMQKTITRILHHIRPIINIKA